MTKASILLIATACLGLSSTSAADPVENGLLHRLMSQERRRLQPPPRDGGGGDGAGTGAPDDGDADTCEAEDLPCACGLLGDVGFTSASGTVPGTDTFLDVGENIYGPFEAGFTEQNKDLFLSLGCTENNVEGAYVVGGIDTHTVVSIINEVCDISLPYTDGEGTYHDLLDQCGGHTTEYHFHERLSCLYEASGAHSTQVGLGIDGKGLYGKWEDFDGSELPELDACGGHFGTTPDSNGEVLYHYHVQDTAPFTFGCFGPMVNETQQRLVSVEECRAMYDSCGDDSTNLTVGDGETIQYDLYCPCFDADGKNVGPISPLPALSSNSSKYGPATSEIDAALGGGDVSVLDLSTVIGSSVMTMGFVAVAAAL